MSDTWIQPARQKLLCLAADAAAITAQYRAVREQMSRLMTAKLKKENFLSDFRNRGGHLRLPKDQLEALNNQISAMELEITNFGLSITDAAQKLGLIETDAASIQSLYLNAKKLAISLGIVSEEEVI